MSRYHEPSWPVQYGQSSGYFGDPDRRIDYVYQPRSKAPGPVDPRFSMATSTMADFDNPKSFRTATALKVASSEFADKTSMQGVGYIHMSRTIWLKLMWLILLVSACGAMIFHLYYLCSIYFAYPRQTKISLGFDDLQFPAITVCNINPIRSSMLDQAGSGMEKLMNVTNVWHQIRNLNGSATDATGKKRRKRALGDLDDFNYTSTYTEYEDVTRDEGDTWANKANKTDSAKLGNEFDELYSKMSRNKRIRLGHQLNDFLVVSSFSGRKVSPDTYIWRQSMQYGNCFTLEYDDFTSRKSGPKDGLEMILFLETEEYLHGWTNGNGAHMIVHNVGTIPQIEKDGIALSGGTETFIGLRRINIERLTLPYGNCNDGIEYKSKFNITYTRQICQDHCLVYLTAENCGCYDERQEELNINFDTLATYGPCRQRAEIKCVLEINRDYEFGRKSCICHSPCSEVHFERSISSRQWPSVQYGEVLMEAICKKSARQCDKLRNYDQYQLAQNFIKLNIYYEDLNYENITEEPDYADVQFVSDIGGTLGLWIGLSVLSIIEVGQFLVTIAAVLCGCRKADRKPGDRVRPDQTAPEINNEFSEPKALSPTFTNGYHNYH